MKTGTNLKRLIVTILQVFFATLLLVYLIVNTVVDVARSKLYYTTLSFETAQSLPPPAFTMCTSDTVKYKFQCAVYGNVTTDCPGLINTVDVSGDDLYSSWFSQCYVFQTQQPIFPMNPSEPPKNWTAFQSAVYVRYQLNNATTISKMSLMLWNPFDIPADTQNLSVTATPQILSPYEITQMDACRERVYTFYWQKHVFLNGTEKWTVNWRTELGVASNAFGTNTSAIGLIHLKPGSFVVPTTREYTILPFIPILTTFLVLLAALYSTYYAIVAGRGKYRPWGLVHSITRYFPQRHLPIPKDADQEHGLKPTPKDDADQEQGLKPTTEDIMRVYLEDTDKAEFEKP